MVLSMVVQGRKSVGIKIIAAAEQSYNHDSCDNFDTLSAAFPCGAIKFLAGVNLHTFN